MRPIAIAKLFDSFLYAYAYGNFEPASHLLKSMSIMVGAKVPVVPFTDELFSERDKIFRAYCNHNLSRVITQWDAYLKRVGDSRTPYKMDSEGAAEKVKNFKPTPENYNFELEDDGE